MPDWRALIQARLGDLPVDPARASDIIHEMSQHAAQHHAELVASGLSEDEAVERALAPLNNPERLALEIARADRPRPSSPAPPAATGRLLRDLGADIRYAVRLLWRAPAFTALAVITLGLGIGMNSAMFSVLNAVLLRPLPYSDPGGLVVMGEQGREGSPGNVGYTTFLDWKARTRSFADMAVLRDFSTTLTVNGEPRRLAGIRVTSNYFRLLGAKPALGRDFSPEEDDPAHWRVVILSDALWRRDFGGDPKVIGSSITMSDRAYTIIGVMPPDFEELIGEHYHQAGELWSLMGYDVSLPYACRNCEHLRAVARLKPGVTLAAAAADVNLVHRQLRAEYPGVYGDGSSVALRGLAEEFTAGVAPTLKVLMAAVAFVLLIACANVASLLLARMSGRRHDLALRASLGASRWRIVRQLVSEAGCLALAGGVAGIVVSISAVPLIAAAAPASVFRIAAVRTDSSVLIFSLIVAMASVLLFGLLPALQASRIDLRGALHGTGRSSATGPASRARRVLVAGDLALAVVLLAGAGLMIKSVEHLLAVDPGFRADHVMTMQIAMLGQAYATNEQVVAKTDAILERLRALPGVASVAAASQVPLAGDFDNRGFHIQERPSPNPANDPAVERYGVTPDYFDVMKIPLISGRLFNASDRADSEPVILVNERVARTLFAGGNPVGEHVRIGGNETTEPVRRIIGVVGDVRHSELAAPPLLQMYTPQTQFTDSFLTLAIRTRGDSTGAGLAGEARQAITTASGGLPVYKMTSLSDLVEKSVGPRRFVMRLLELFGFVALLMTAVGVYGVISQSVVARTREFGIRAALGASPADIGRLVLRSGFTAIAVGLGAGIVLALGTTRYLEGSLYDVKATDPLTLVLVTLVLLAVAIGAQSLPIVRAVRVDPVVSLRQD